MARLNLKPAVVVAIEEDSPSVQQLRVSVDGKVARAVNYLAFGPPVVPGQQVVVNTTAVELGLGSGGYHFVVPGQAKWQQGWGHQIKLRYTPLQIQVDCAEEQTSPWHYHFLTPAGLGGVPVLSAELHSMLPPLALALRELNPKGRIVYVATDGGALPVAFSRNVAWLREREVLAGVVSSGHSFGGDVETVNVFTGLQAAVRVLGADYVIVTMGPGIAGTGTVYGFSGLEQGFVLQAAWALGGIPVAVPRIGFSEWRRRHRAVSHHTITVLTWAYSGPALLPLPLLPQPARRHIAHRVRCLPARYKVCWRDGRFVQALALRYPRLFSSMGRDFAADPAFFLALGAAARLAVDAARSKPLR